MSRNVHTMRNSVAAALTIVLLPFATAAQEPPSYGPPIGIELARKIAASALTEARKNKWPMAIAIVDTHGFLKYYEMMDDTQTASADIAIDKARSAAMFRRETKSFQDGIDKGRTAILGLPGAMPIEGGLPILVDGRVIGGIGVSGMSSAQDAQVARAGLRAVSETGSAR
jgi:glc operon protein GlcG